MLGSISQPKWDMGTFCDELYVNTASLQLNCGYLSIDSVDLHMAIAVNRLRCMLMVSSDFYNLLRQVRWECKDWELQRNAGAAENLCNAISQNTYIISIVLFEFISTTFMCNTVNHFKI